MRFGVFDHMDRNGVNVGQQYRDRLQLIEAYDRAGFYAYHVAEHHGTPLGVAPSPSVFLSAVAQRTSSIRFGPLVYTLSLYHPLRLIEEICMLDQLSGGRFELGVGKGISPIECGFYGVGEEVVELYEESLEIILYGLEHGRLNYAGKHFNFNEVPLELRPIQYPRPPLWYGVARAESTPKAASLGMNIVTNGDAKSVRIISDQFREEWKKGPYAADPITKIGMSRHVVVGKNDNEARTAARAAYRQWFENLSYLWKLNDIPLPLNLPEDPDEAIKAGLCIAGSAETVRTRMHEEISEAGINYLVCRLAFGNLTLEQSLQSVALLQHEVMPAFVLRDMENPT
jgi:alkanesulfonate monooxygenase SsuD/methylene tetrahydromethanopterin reductase-like flavin-dependent oxidoreductase (luciferase family)